MTNSISRAKEILAITRKAPGMFAYYRESLLSRVATVLEMAEVDFVATKFYGKHAGTYGNTYKTLHDTFDDNWAHQVIDDALKMIEEKENV